MALGFTQPAKLEGWSGGIPHLAKNERDVGPTQAPLPAGISQWSSVAWGNLSASLVAA
jgi:hypothetical protein